MKLYASVIALLLYTLALPSVFAQSVVSGQQLEIGGTGTDQVSAGLVAGAIGSSNVISGGESLAVGIQNTSLGVMSLMLGLGNYVQAEGLANAIFGEINSSYGAYMLILGFANTADEASYYGNSSPDSVPALGLISGMYNYLGGLSSNSIIAGSNNHVDGVIVWGQYGPSEITPIDSSSTFGRGLINKWSNATVVGSFNDSSTTSPVRFVVGNGIHSSNRSNALEVYEDGKVVIPMAQGDILMGEFGD